MGNVKLARSPQERGGLWKRECERKPLGGERISIVRCALSPLKEVVARTPVDGSCVTLTVKQIESHTSPQDTGRTLLRKRRTQSIKDNTQTNGHRKAKGAKTGAFRLPSYLICPQDLLCNLPLGQPHIHSLPLYVLVSLLLRHAQIGDQRTFRPIHDPQILDLLL